MGALRPGLESLRAEVRSLCEEWHAAGRFWPRCDAWLRSANLEFSRELAARGLIGMTWPAPFGRQLSNLHRLAVTEELLRSGAPVAAHWIGDRQIGPAVLRHGSAELRAEILPGIATGRHFFCLGMSEPEAGSDLASVRTRATATAGGFRVTGRKTWTSGAHLATHAYVLARTTPAAPDAPQHRGLSEFIIDMDAPGITVTPIIDMSGEHHFNEMSFDDVFVPAHRVIGDVGNGWRQVTEQLAFERGGPERILTTYPLLGEVVRAAHTDRAGLVEPLGRLSARLAVLRRLCWRIAGQLDAGHAPIQEAATCKLLGNEFERDVLELARRLDHVPTIRQHLAEALLASPGFSIRGGATDVLLAMITKREVSP